MVTKQRGKVDIIAVANAANVSPSTVSRTFNHPDLVNPATRKKINQAVRKLGYIRNRAAQAMHGKRSASIGLVVPTINHAIFAEMIQSFSDAIDDAGFTLLIASHGYNLDTEYAMVRKLMEHRVDGLALIGSEHSRATYRMIRQQDVPTMTLWNHDEATELPCVGVDNLQAGALASSHLIELGHRKIGLIFPSTKGNDRARLRLEGVQNALQKAHVEVQDDWQREAPYSITHGKSAALEILGQTHRPSALLCGNDILAQGAIFAAQKLGLSIPQDISIIGIGDFKGSADMEPGLTTVRIPAESIGKIAGDAFSNFVVSDEKVDFSHRCELELIVRDSTALPH